MNKKMLTYGAVVLGIVFIGVAIMYWTTAAGSLPVFVPGYENGVTAVHFKHGLASLILAVALFIFAWFRSGNQRPSDTNTSDATMPPPMQ